MTDQRHTVRVDTRRRVTLPKEHAKLGDLYFITVRPDGEIRLKPAEVIPVGSFGVNDPAAD